MEEFKSIKEYENYYEISNYGRVRSLYGRYKNCEFKKPYVRNDGYVVVNLIKDKKQKTFYLHKLVAEYFIENNNDSYTEVNHIDGDKQNNSYSNLEWCSSRENKLHAYNYGLTKRGHDRPSSKLSESDVRSIPALIKDGHSIKEISSKFGVSTTSIHHVLKGRNFGYLNLDFGYKFKIRNNKDNTEISVEIKKSTPS